MTDRGDIDTVRARLIGLVRRDLPEFKRARHAARKAAAAVRREEENRRRKMIEQQAAPIQASARAALDRLPWAVRDAEIEHDADTEALEKIGFSLKVQRREAERLRALILRDQTDRERDLRRITARREVMENRFVNLDDTKDTLPAEQLAADEFEPVTVYLPEDTVRDHETIKRVSRIHKLLRRGVLEMHEFSACLWYRERWELSGLDPLISSNFDPKYGSGAKDFHHMAKTPTQVEARSDFRYMNNAVPADVRKLLDAVVLHDMTIEDAGRAVKIGYRNTAAAFRRAVLQLYEVASPMMPTTRSKIY